MNILGYELDCTCGACPEQYDVFKNNEKVGYLRLRHGYFYASCLGGQIVYESNTKGDGCFMLEERDFHLNNAIEAINKYINK